MLGTATSLNVSVAAGVVLYEVRRKAMAAEPE
jgi:tRNA G18 (ribose-2'-O)-methylase SpoU